MTAGNDVIGLQRAVVEIVTDDGARGEWLADPRGFADRRLSGSAATALAGISPLGMQAMTLSHVAKKDRFDHLHRLHHELEARKAAEGRGHDAVHDGGAHHRHGDAAHGHTHGDPS